MTRPPPVPQPLPEPPNRFSPVKRRLLVCLRSSRFLNCALSHQSLCRAQVSSHSVFCLSLHPPQSKAFLSGCFRWVSHQRSRHLSLGGLPHVSAAQFHIFIDRDQRVTTDHRCSDLFNCSLEKGNFWTAGGSFVFNHSAGVCWWLLNKLNYLNRKQTVQAFTFMITILLSRVFLCYRG